MYVNARGMRYKHMYDNDKTTRFDSGIFVLHPMFPHKHFDNFPPRADAQKVYREMRPDFYFKIRYILALYENLSTVLSRAY